VPTGVRQSAHSFLPLHIHINREPRNLDLQYDYTTWLAQLTRGMIVGANQRSNIHFYGPYLIQGQVRIESLS
jgi:hypothetical protein